MLSLNILERVVEIKMVDHHPDYDLTPYKGPCTSNYVFKDSITTPQSLSSVINVAIGRVRIIHSDDLKNLAEDNSIMYSPPINGEYIIETAMENDEDIFFSSGFAPEIDQFNLNEIKAKVSNDESRTIGIICKESRLPSFRPGVGTFSKRPP